MIAEIITCNNNGVVTLLKLWLEKHILIKLLLLNLIFTIVSIILLERSIFDILFLRGLAVIFVLVLLLALLLRQLTSLFFELILP